MPAVALALPATDRDKRRVTSSPIIAPAAFVEFEGFIFSEASQSVSFISRHVGQDNSEVNMGVDNGTTRLPDEQDYEIRNHSREPSPETATGNSISMGAVSFVGFPLY